MSDQVFDSERISRYFRGEASGNDAEYINEIFCSGEHEKKLRVLLSKQFEDITDEEGEEKKNLDHILHRIHYNINSSENADRKSRFSKFINVYLKIAGILILPLVLYFAVKNHISSDNVKESWTEINAPAWTRAQFSLPDGTTGWLNSSSSIRYNGDFTHDRQIILKGEAFFDVYKDKSRPFRVNAKDIVVKVLGTKFNVASYDNEENVEVVLEEGKIEIDDIATSKSFVLKPSELAVYDKNQKNIYTSTVETQKYLSWKDGKLVFRNDPLDVIARRLERWYNVEVDIDSDSLHDLRLRATFVDESLEKVLYYLKRSLPIDYTIIQGDANAQESYSKTKVILSTRTK